MLLRDLKWYPFLSLPRRQKHKLDCQLIVMSHVLVQHPKSKGERKIKVVLSDKHLQTKGTKYTQIKRPTHTHTYTHTQSQTDSHRHTQRHGCRQSQEWKSWSLTIVQSWTMTSCRSVIAYCRLFTPSRMDDTRRWWLEMRDEIWVMMKVVEERRKDDGPAPA